MPPVRWFFYLFPWEAPFDVPLVQRIFFLHTQQAQEFLSGLRWSRLLLPWAEEVKLQAVHTTKDA